MQILIRIEKLSSDGTFKEKYRNTLLLNDSLDFDLKSYLKVFKQLYPDCNINLIFS